MTTSKKTAITFAAGLVAGAAAVLLAGAAPAGTNDNETSLTQHGDLLVLWEHNDTGHLTAVNVVEPEAAIAQSLKQRIAELEHWFPAGVDESNEFVQEGRARADRFQAILDKHF